MIVTCNEAHNRVPRFFITRSFVIVSFHQMVHFVDFTQHVCSVLCTLDCALMNRNTAFLTCIHWIIACSCSISVFILIKQQWTAFSQEYGSFLFSIRFENLQKLFTVCLVAVASRHIYESIDFAFYETDWKLMYRKVQKCKCFGRKRRIRNERKSSVSFISILFFYEHLLRERNKDMKCNDLFDGWFHWREQRVFVPWKTAWKIHHYSVESTLNEVEWKHRTNDKPRQKEMNRQRRNVQTL